MKMSIFSFHLSKDDDRNFTFSLYMSEILPIRRKTQPNQSINQSIFNLCEDLALSANW